MRALVTEARINEAYHALGYTIGWRFMTCPETRFDDPQMLLMGLNPSGTVETHPRWSQEVGSAFEVEEWGAHSRGAAPLQRQVQRLVQLAGYSFDQVASGNFVPFRSQRWSDLHHADEAVRFSTALWRDFASDVRPKLIVCLGGLAGHHLASVFKVRDITRLPSGWGRVTLTVGSTPYGRFVAVPHLGTFKLLSRRDCTQHLAAALGVADPVYA